MSETLLTIEELKHNWDFINENVTRAAARSGRNAADIKVIAVSKTHPAELVERAIQAGIKTFGENYAQECRDKYLLIDEILKTDAEWHFIGHLQTNKVKYLAPFVNAIHSVDSLHLAEEISKQAARNNRTIEVLLQVNTSGEESKSGCEPEEAAELAYNISKIEHINLTGLMTIGSFTDDEFLIRKEFTLLRNIKDVISRQLPELNLRHLSMGMSGDYDIAIEEGATMVRIGTAVFGRRIYPVSK